MRSRLGSPRAASVSGFMALYHHKRIFASTNMLSQRGSSGDLTTDRANPRTNDQSL
jgi:hypothetical protein